jgi:hypothetical protein
MVIDTLIKYFNQFFNIQLGKNLLKSIEPFLKTITKKQTDKTLLRDQVRNISILDPSCGSGRFLIQLAEVLLTICCVLFPKTDRWTLKTHIIEDNLYGIDFDKKACIISKIRLFIWLLEDIPNKSDVLNKFKTPNLKDLDRIGASINDLGIKFNILDHDFLLNYRPKFKFNIIIGNPPYVDNKTMNKSYKQKLYRSFESAYKLFDLSIVFIEQSLRILKQDYGILCFIITNKFLSSNYGVKIRNLLMKNAHITQILNISSLQIFSTHSVYPIILTLFNTPPTKESKITIQTYDSIKKLTDLTNSNRQSITQEQLYSLPDRVIPLKGDINLINSLFSHFETMEGKFSDLQIIYRPYAFTNYGKYYQYADEKNQSEDDLILLGTGNVGKFYYKFHKKIRIANHSLPVCYFHTPAENKSKMEIISTQKLIFREIAKDLTCAYDPGIFTNITGLYFIRIPSLSTNELFALLAILNSHFIDSLFKSLYSTLHMSQGYLRFNGSFIKTLPMPHSLPKSVAAVSKILQFLTQYNYDIQHSNNLREKTAPSMGNEYISFFQKLSEALVRMLYLSELDQQIQNQFYEIYNMLISDEWVPNFEFIFPTPYFNLTPFIKQPEVPFSTIFSQIKTFYESNIQKPDLLGQISTLTSQYF